MSKRVKVPLPAKGFVYVGLWYNGKLGWGLPDFVGTRHSPENPSEKIAKWGRFTQGGDRLFLCEVVLRPVTDRRGRPITALVRGAKRRNRESRR